MDVQKYSGKFTGKAAGSVLLTLAAALALWLFIAANFRRTATAEIFRSLVTINSHKAGEIAAWVRLHRREAERFSRHPFLGEIISAEQAKPGSRRARLDAWVKEYASQEQTASMALLSPKGAVIAGTPGYRAGTEKHFTEAFARASLEGKAGLTDLYLAADGRPRMTMLSPISAGGRGGRTQCVLVINIDPGTEFYPLLKAQPQFFESIESLLVRVEDGHLLALNDVEGKPGSALRLRRPLSDKGLPKVRAVKDLAAGYHDAGIDHRGVKIFRAASPVEGTDWALATHIDRDTILAPVKTRERLALALILLASGLIYIAAYFILRSGRAAAAAALEKNRRLLAETEQIGKVGGWEYNIDTGELLCTAEVCRIHELPPDHKFDLNRDTSFYTPASRQLIERAMRRAIESGKGFDLELEILTARGNLRAVHVIARPDKGNRRIYGFFQDITERKLAEEKLRESEERQRITLEVTQIGTWDWNVETDAWSASPTYYTMLGYDPEQGPGDRQAWLNRVHPDDRDMIAARIRGVLAGTRDRYQYEARIKHADGTYRWQAVLGKTVRSGENGKAARIMGVRMDITERKLAEEALQRSEADIKATLQNLLVGVVTHAADTSIISSNYEAQRILGLSAEQLSGKKAIDPAWMFVHKDLSKMELADYPVNKAITDKCPFSDMLLGVHRPDRDYITWLNVGGIPLYSGDGSLTKVIINFVDITERKRIEEALQESSARLQTAMNMMPIGLWVINAEGNIEVSSAAAQRIWAGAKYVGIDKLGEYKGWRTDNGKQIGAHEWAGARAFEKGETTIEEEVEIECFDGTHKIILDSAVPLRKSDGSIYGAITINQDITERKQSEQKLRESEARYRALVDASGDGILTADLESMKFRFANRAICRMLGYTAEELTDLAVADIHPKEALPAVIAEFEAQARGEKTLAPNLPCLRKDGSVFYADITTTPVTFDGRRCNLGVFRDITERKRNEELNGTRLHLMEFSAGHTLDEMLEQALNKAEELTGSLIGFCHFIEADQKTLWLQNWSTRTKRDFCRAEGKGSHYSVDRAGVWTDCVRARKPVIHNDYASLPHKKGLPPGHAPVIRELVVPVMRGDKVVAIMGVGNKASDYTEKDIEALSPLADLSWEIVNRKRAEEALRESERLLRESQSRARLGSYALDINTGLWKCSSILEEIFGINTAYPHTVEGWEALLHPEDRAMMSAYLRDEVIGRKRPFDKEYRVVRQDTGAARWVHGLGGLKFDAQGRPLEMHGTIQDIHERKLAELELERVNLDLVAKRQEMENFLYVTTHDLRSPLVNIQGFAQNLERYLRELKEELSPARLRQPVGETVSRLTGKEIPEALKFVLESSHKMDALINSLLKVSRLGRVEMKPVNLEMNDLVNKVVAATHYQLEAAGAAAKVGILPPCKADPAAVSQIFANLLENAIKYRAEDRPLSVTITGETSGAGVLYKVADNGSGIAPRDLGRIWDIFYRGSGAGEGEGIGLTVVKYMAGKNGGTIRAESEEGRGTVFYLELPAAGGTK